MFQVATQTTLMVDCFYRNKLLKIKPKEVQQSSRDSNVLTWDQWTGLLNTELNRVRYLKFM